ncbi:MAG TPA: IS1380 family transposase [Mycobacterium sp.]|nr:IS1380 family transposase [Mycobacterium sp.]
MVHGGADVPEGPVNLDSVQVRFDEQRLISDAGLLVCATLADRLGVEELVNESVWLDPRAPGAALPGRKVMSLVHGMLAGADSIDDMNVLRAGSTGLILGHRVMAPSTLGTFLRAFTFGHVRQLDRVLDQALCRSWQAGAGPGDGPLVIDIDSFVGEVHGYQKQGASYGYTHKLGYHPIVAVRADTGELLHIRNRKGKANTQRGAERFVDELLARVSRAGYTGPIVIRADIGFENHKLFKVLDARGIEFSIGVKHSTKVKRLIEEIPEGDWVTVADYPEDGEAQIAEIAFGDWRLIVRRTRLIGAQAELFPDWRHHCFVTNRTVPILTADTDHRDHATIELVIRDLKDQALCHFPSGRFAANSAWTVIAALAHNLGRWVTQIGLPNEPVQTARSRRRQLLQIPARLTRTSRIWTLRLPARWPWQHQFTTVLDKIRSLPALA